MAKPRDDDDDEDEWEEYWSIRPPGYMKNYHTSADWSEAENVRPKKGFKFLHFAQRPEEPEAKDG